MAKKQISKKSNKKNKQSLNYKFKQNKAKSLVGLIFILVIAFVGVKLLFNSFAAVAYSLNAPPVGIAASGTSTSAGTGYWIAASDGGVFAEGNATFYGSMGGKPLSAPIVAISATLDKGGYWLLGRDGAVYGFGDAQFHGGLNTSGGVTSCPGNVGNAIGITDRGSNLGYFIMTSTGATYGYGQAGSFGYCPNGFGNTTSIVSMSASNDGYGYSAVASHGQTYVLGNAGPCGNPNPNATNIVAVATSSVGGCWITGSDGGVFAYGNAQYYGGMTGKTLAKPIIGIAGTPDGKGYWLLGGDGGVFAFGDATYAGSVSYTPPVVGAPDCSKVPNSHLASGACVCNTGFNTTAFGCLAPVPGTPPPPPPAAGSLGAPAPDCSKAPNSHFNIATGQCDCNNGFNTTAFGCLSPDKSVSLGSIAPDCSKAPDSHFNIATGQCDCNNGFNKTAFGCIFIPITNQTSVNNPNGTKNHNCLFGFGWKSLNIGSGLGACQADPKTYSFQQIAALSQLSGIQINISTLRSNYYYLCSTNFCSDPNKLIH